MYVRCDYILSCWSIAVGSLKRYTKMTDSYLIDTLVANQSSSNVFKSGVGMVSSIFQIKIQDVEPIWPCIIHKFSSLSAWSRLWSNHLVFWDRIRIHLPKSGDLTTLHIHCESQHCHYECFRFWMNNCAYFSLLQILFIFHADTYCCTSNCICFDVVWNVAEVPLPNVLLYKAMLQWDLCN